MSFQKSSLLFLALSCLWLAFPQDGYCEVSNPTAILDNSIQSLETLESELQNWKTREIELTSSIDSLQSQIASSTQTSLAQQSLLETQKKLLADYQSKVSDQSKLYEQSLTSLKRSEQSLRISNLTWEIGIPTALAAGIVAGILINKR